MDGAAAHVPGTDHRAAVCGMGAVASSLLHRFARCFPGRNRHGIHVCVCDCEADLRFAGGSMDRNAGGLDS